MRKAFFIILIITTVILEMSFIGGTVLAVRSEKFKSLMLLIPQTIINLCAIYLLAQNL